MLLSKSAVFVEGKICSLVGEYICTLFKSHLKASAHSCIGIGVPILIAFYRSGICGNTQFFRPE